MVTHGLKMLKLVANQWLLPMASLAVLQAASEAPEPLWRAVVHAHRGGNLKPAQRRATAQVWAGDDGRRWVVTCGDCQPRWLTKVNAVVIWSSAHVSAFHLESLIIGMYLTLYDHCNGSHEVQSSSRHEDMGI